MLMDHGPFRQRMQTSMRYPANVVSMSLIAATYSAQPKTVAAVMTHSLWSAQSTVNRQSTEAQLLHMAQDVATIDEVLKHVLSKSVAVESKVLGSSGYSVLHSAVQGKRPVQVICKLLKVGADPLAKDAAGQTPADLARATGQTLIAQLLDRAATDEKAKAEKKSSSFGQQQQQQAS